MTIQFSLPGWSWLLRLMRWWRPDLQERAERFGEGRAQSRYLGGAVEVGATMIRNRD